MEPVDLVTSTLLLPDDIHRCDDGEDDFQELIPSSLSKKCADDGLVQSGELRRATKAGRKPDEELHDGMARSNVARFRHAAAFILSFLSLQIDESSPSASVLMF